MSDLKYWLGFSKIFSIGTVRLSALLGYFETIEHCWNATTADLLEIDGFTMNLIEKFHAEKKALGDLGKYEEEISKKNIQVITFKDEEYPYYLKQIYDPPLALYVKGDLSRCNFERCLAVVGSRKCSDYIKQILNKIIDGLRNTDITIVSGMAIGIDACAHNSAINSDLPTIAVLGSGFDNIYPKQNKEMFRQISEKHGAVLSEYYPDTQPLPMFFPRRNRIVTGLSQGTLVAEAGLRSGALISARLCLEQDRELMCIPGMVSNPNTEGAHKLIKEGSAVVTESEDILKHLKWENVNFKKDLNSNAKIKLLDKEKEIYEILNLEPKCFDNLVQESKLSTEELMATLTTMELKGIIIQMPGQKFAKNL